MPEYLAPGVFVEEVSFRAKSIEGVPTSTTGFVGMSRYGPVHYENGPRSSQPRLLTSFTEFERVYGPLEELEFSEGLTQNLLAHGARAFFLNGGRRLYISRVFAPITDDAALGVASHSISVPITPGAVNLFWRARWPGAMGNAELRIQALRSKNVVKPAVVARPATATSSAISAMPVQANRAVHGSIIEVSAQRRDVEPFVLADLRVVVVDNNVQRFYGVDGAEDTTLTDASFLHLVELQVDTHVWGAPVRRSSAMTLHPRHPRWIGQIFDRDDPEDEDAAVWFDTNAIDYMAQDGMDAPVRVLQLFMALIGTAAPTTQFRLQGGNDGVRVAPTGNAGLEGRVADPDDVDLPATGLQALAEIDDISIVAAPDAGGYPSKDDITAAAEQVILHAEQCRYRIGIVDAPPGSSINEIREFRGRFDSTRAALYHPWLEILDPTKPSTRGGPSPRLAVPSSGFVAGVYARTDITRGVHKAPANEVVFGLSQFETNINTGRNEVLNPEGINALRFMPGRGPRVWGARTLTSDPEWKYVNVRRLFIYLEHSIDKATQWAVFEPNNDQLWRRITRSVKDFLEVQWRDGALLGLTPDEAFFVRCDRTTMTQNDIDNGRLICLIGVAPTRPAEFVIFRIGQWTAEAKG
jgi:uncharacterized protein